MKIQVRDARGNAWELEREQIASLKAIHRGMDVIRYDLRLFPSLKTQLGWTDKLHLSVAEGRRLAGVLVSRVEQKAAAASPISAVEESPEVIADTEPIPASASEDAVIEVEETSPAERSEDSISEPPSEDDADSAAVASPVEPSAPTGIDAIRAAIKNAGK